MSKQTAVEWMIDKIINKQNGTFDGFPVLSLDEIFEQAKEIDKEQRIDDIVQFGIKYEHKYSQMEIIKLCESAEKYYNETYKKKQCITQF
jgi:hypothetical protein